MLLTSTSIIAAVVIKTFIVLTIFDRVSSETERQFCTRIIESLYNENNPYKIFRKGFLGFSQIGIESYNSFLTEQHHDRLLIIVQSMISYKKNLYAKGYFKDVLKQTIIEGKDRLQNPNEFCLHNFTSYAVSCRDIIHQKLLINPEWSGSEVFDFFYKTWTKRHIKLDVLFYREMQFVRNSLEEGSDLERAYYWSFYTRSYEEKYNFISLFYKQFEDIVNDPRLIYVSDIQTPETQRQLCTRFIESLYNENDPYKIFRKGFLGFNKIVIEDFNRFIPEQNHDILEIIFQSMISYKKNLYTKGYFKDVLKRTLIEGKDRLQNPNEFCDHNFNNDAETCRNIIHKKLLISPDWSGSEVFDFFYKTWTKKHMQLDVLFYKDIQSVQNSLEGHSELEKAYSMAYHSRAFQNLFEFIIMYYKQFEDVVKDRRFIYVSDIQTPGDYCTLKVPDSVNFIVY